MRGGRVEGRVRQGTNEDVDSEGQERLVGGPFG